MEPLATAPHASQSTPRASTSRGLILASLCLSALIINLDVTIVNVTLPSLVRQLDATTTELQWVVDAYNLVFAALILAAGSLSDRLGRKGVLLAGLGVFAVASLAGAFASTPGQLIVARAVMGVGAAAIFPATLSIIANVFTERAARAKAIGLWGATTGVGIAAGPIIGGWLLEHFWWGSVFLFMAPVATVIAAVVGAAVPTSRDPSAPRIDRRGLAISTAGMGLLVFGIIEAPNWGWGSPTAVAVLTAGLAIMAVFVMVEQRTARPMLDVDLFRDLRFTAASGSITIGFFALTGFTFLITQYFQFVKDYSPLSTGVRILPVAISVAAAAVIGTKLAVRVGNKAVVAGGLLLFGATLMWIAAVASPDTSYPVIALQMVFGGTGLGLINAPATEAIMGAVHAAKAGIGSAVNDATRLFGATLGVAVIGSVAASLYTSELKDTLPADVPAEAAAAAEGSVGAGLIAARQLGDAGLDAAGRDLSAAAVDAFLHGLAGGLRIAGAVALAGSMLAFLLLPARPSTPRDPITALATAPDPRPPADSTPEPAPRAPDGYSRGAHPDASRAEIDLLGAREHRTASRTRDETPRRG